MVVVAPTETLVMPPRTREVAVSVLVPICNVERYLDQCLSSLVGQTFGDFEVICINDGSTDGSRAIIQRFLDADRRFRVIDKPNSGYGASMNLGLDNAVGRYVAILESDDFYDSRALELLHGAAASSGAEVIKANFWLYWSLPDERRELFRVVDERQAGRTLAPLDDPAVFFRKPSIWSALYLRGFLTECGIRFLESPGASYQDSGFNFKVWAAARRATLLEDPILCYRQDNEKSSINNPGKVFCVCDEYASMAEYLESHDELDRSRLWGILERMKYDAYLWNLDRLDDGLQEQFAARASREFSHDLEAGRVDLSLFGPGARAALRQLADDPRSFVRDHNAARVGGATAALTRYWHLGGPGLVLSVLGSKLFGRSATRTDARGASA